jgi:2,3-dihydroxybenzoate-AMP ligase
MSRLRPGTITAVVPAVAARWLDYHLAHPSDQLAYLEGVAQRTRSRIKPVLGATLQQVFGMARV